MLNVGDEELATHEFIHGGEVKTQPMNLFMGEYVCI